MNISFLAIADVYRLEGNKECKNKELLNAVYFYTEGLQVNCKDDNLNARLYHNRATAYFYLGEISSVQFLADSSVQVNHHIFCRVLMQTSLWARSSFGQLSTRNADADQLWVCAQRQKVCESQTFQLN